MQTRYVQKGQSIDFKNNGSELINEGQAVVFGTKVYVASTDIAVGETGTLSTIGVYTCEKDSSDISLGAKVYYNSSTDKVTATESDAIEMGIAIEEAGSATNTVKVKIG